MGSAQVHLHRAGKRDLARYLHTVETCLIRGLRTPSNTRVSLLKDETSIGDDVDGTLYLEQLKKDLQWTTDDDKAALSRSIISLQCWAALAGDAVCIRKLVSSGSSVEKPPSIALPEVQLFSGWPPLHLALASFSGRVDAVAALLDLGASPLSKNSSLGSPVLVSAAFNLMNVKQLQFWMERFPTTDVNCCDSALGLSPLSASTCGGHLMVPVVKELLQCRASPLCLAGDGGLNKAVLNAIATQSPHPEALRVLLENGGSATMRYEMGWNKFRILHVISSMVVRCKSNPGVLFQTLADSPGKTPLHIAAETGNVDMVRLLLEHRADSSSRTPKGDTPLALAEKTFGVLPPILRQAFECQYFLLSNGMHGCSKIIALDSGLDIIGL